MSKSSQPKIQWLCVITLGVMFLGTQPVTGQPGGEATTDPVITADQMYRLQQLAAIDEDRESVVKNLAHQWAGASGESSDILEQILGTQGTEQLLSIQNATHFDQVRLIVQGQDPDDSAFLTALEGTTAEPRTLGDLDKDYVYTAVTPCKILDTRVVGGEMAPDEQRNFVVHGDVAGQGGSAAGCPSPRGEPRAAHINFVAIPRVGQGNLAPYPFGGSSGGSLVNYRFGSGNNSNAATVQTCFLCGPDITLNNKFGTAHVVGIVQGYYHEVEKITKYLSISARGGFVPHEDDGSFANCFPNTFAWSGVGDSRFYAMVNLPQGAMVSRLTYHFWRGAPTVETRADLFRQPVPATTTRTAMATVISTSSDSGHTSRSDSSISNATIDNENFTYYMEVDLPQAGQMCTDGVVIRYTDIP